MFSWVLKYLRYDRTLTGGGGTDLERGYGDVRPWRPPFHASPAARKGPISSKRVSSQDPLLRKFGNFQLKSPQNLEIFSSQAPKFGNFQLTSPKIWKFSAHKPPDLEMFRSQAPLFRGKCQFASPTLKSGPHTSTWKKVECPPRHFIWPNLGFAGSCEYLLNKSAQKRWNFLRFKNLSGAWTHKTDRGYEAFMITRNRYVFRNR